MNTGQGLTEGFVSLAGIDQSLKTIVKILAEKRQVRKVHLTDKPDVVPWGEWQLKWSPEEYRTLWRILSGKGTHRPIASWVMLHDLIMKDPRNRNYWSTTADGRVVKYYNGTQVLITGVNDFRIQLKSVIELMWQDLWEHPKIDEVLSINRCSEEQIEEYKRNSECDSKSCSVMLQDMQSIGKFNIRLMVKHLNEKTSDSNSKCSPTL